MINLDKSFTNSNKNEAGEKLERLMADYNAGQFKEDHETQEVQEALLNDCRPKVSVSDGLSLSEIKNESPKALTSLQENFALFSGSTISCIAEKIYMLTSLCCSDIIGAFT